MQSCVRRWYVEGSRGTGWMRVVSSMLQASYAGERATGTRCTMGWVGHTAGLYSVEDIESVASAGNPTWALHFVTLPCTVSVSSPPPPANMIQDCKIWGFHCGDYEECRLQGYKTPVCTSHKTHYVSATVSSRLMLCKIWGFHCGHYEECRLLGYKKPFHTSQETHCVSATDLSRLMLCKIWGFHCGHYEECRLLDIKPSSYLTGDILRLCYRAQPVNAR
jgi:hypothetical protein